MRVIVTRPEPEAQKWVQAIQAQAMEAIALPLVRIGPAPDPGALADAGRRLRDFCAVMFVSGQAVQHFFAALPEAARHWPAATRAWSPGAATARALQQAGIAPALTDAPAADAAQADSESLWLQVQSQIQPGSTVLIVRGCDADAPASETGHGRDWLAQQIMQRGAQVQYAVAYCRAPAHWNEQQRALALESTGSNSIWLFSTARAVDTLQQTLPGQTWAQATALATHPRIASAARAAGFAHVHLTQPHLNVVLQTLAKWSAQGADES